MAAEVNPALRAQTYRNVELAAMRIPSTTPPYSAWSRWPRITLSKSALVSMLPRRVTTNASGAKHQRNDRDLEPGTALVQNKEPLEALNAYMDDDRMLFAVAI